MVFMHEVADCSEKDMVLSSAKGKSLMSRLLYIRTRTLLTEAQLEHLSLMLKWINS